MTSKIVMFVDDEANILKSLKRMFKREDFETVYMNSGEEALSYLKANPCNLIISDIRMPNMNGMELLTQVKELYPTVTRAALSGYTDQSMIFDLIDKNIAKVFLFKPWDSLELKQGVRGLLEFEEVLKSKEVLALINNIDALPSLPELYLKINKMINNDQDINAISKVVQEDQGTTLKILRLANSAFYGRKTGDVNEAIMSMGLNNLKSIILGSSVYTGPKKIAKDLERVWNDSIRTSKLLHYIYKNCLNKKLPSIYGSIGLLIDVGKVLFYLFKYEEYIKVVDISTLTKRSLSLCEKDEFNVTHQELSGYLLNWWELPHEYVEAALFHHSPFHESLVSRELICAVHIASYYATHDSDNNDYETLDPRAMSYLKIEREIFEKSIVDLWEE